MNLSPILSLPIRLIIIGMHPNDLIFKATFAAPPKRMVSFSISIIGTGASGERRVT